MDEKKSQDARKTTLKLAKYVRTRAANDQATSAIDPNLGRSKFAAP